MNLSMPFQAKEDRHGVSQFISWEDFEMGIVKLSRLRIILREKNVELEKLYEEMNKAQMARSRKRADEEILHLSNCRQKATIEELADAKQKLDNAKKKLELRSQMLAPRVAGLVDANSQINKAKRRIQDADKILRGPAGIGRLESLKSSIAWRQRRLIGQILTLYPIRSTSSSLETDLSFFNGKSTNPEVIQASSGSNAQESFQETSASCNSLISIKAETFPVNRYLCIAGTNAMEIISREDGRKFATVLGYVTDILVLAAKYLEVHLRYPLLSAGSWSLILDPTVQANPGDSNTRWPPRSFLSQNGFVVGQAACHALNPEGQEQSKFAQAVGLLNRNIEQLAHELGINVSGQHSLLNYLEKILSGFIDASN